MNRAFFVTAGAKGGKIGGKATGERKRRTAEHYRRISALGVEARRKKANEKK